MRTVALILLACVLASLVTVAALMMALGAAGGLLVAAAIAGAVFLVYVEAIGPWQRRWGATDAEVGRAMPGDDVLGPGAATTTRAITIDAQPGDVFPWLLQIGYGRGGWYSYDWIDNDGEPSADRIDPALQHLEVGDRIQMLPGFGPVVRDVVANHHIVSAGDTDSWCLHVEGMDSGTTRLVSRWRQRWPRGLATRLWIAIVDPGAFIMEQKMLRTIRDRAKEVARGRAETPVGA